MARIVRFSGGPKLTVYSDWFSEPIDIVSEAHRYLWDTIEVQSSVKVSDVFGLLRACPPLVDVFSRFHAAHFLAEADLGPLEPPPSKDPNQRVDYVILEPSCEGGRGGKTFDIHNRMALSAMSIPQASQDAASPDDDGWRIRFGVTPPIRYYLDHPLRVSRDFDLAGEMYGEPDGVTLPELTLEGITLGNLLDSFFFHLSFFGTTEESQVFFTEISEMSKDETLYTPFKIDDLGEETVAENIRRTRLYKSLLEQFFSSYKFADREAIEWTIWELDDAQLASDGIRAKFGNSVELRKKFEHFNGLELRTAYRAALIIGTSARN